MIRLQDVHKELGGKPVLTGVSLTVERGETLVIVGSSGTGKSVTLQHMVGLLKPDRGDVEIDGESIVEARGRRLEAIRSRFGVLFQSGALINWMNIFDNVALPLTEKTTLSESEIADAVHRTLGLVGLRDADKKMPAEMSGGMKKRAALARAIIHSPAIVLYDEPTSGLDPVMARTIDGLIRDLQDRFEVTSVVVTHDLNSAFTVGDRVAMLHEGTIVECAPPEAFRRSGQPYVREFITAQFSADRPGGHER